jgi:hypothetical protein
LRKAIHEVLLQESHSPEDENPPATVNLNMKVTEDERWFFKEFCARHRMSQVEAFREGLELLKRKYEPEAKPKRDQSWRGHG